MTTPRFLRIGIPMLAACASGSHGAPAAAPPAPYGLVPSPRQLKWHEMELYAFVHFSPNTFTDREWGYGDEDPKQFNPARFDAGQIVAALKAGGMKGVILTCKHHDGFCLWPTKTTTHNISASPWKGGKGDIVREFSDACRSNGLKFAAYLSPWDRNHPQYGMAEYVDVYRAQLRELLTNYGPMFETWHDGANGGDGYYGGARTTRTIDRATYYGWKTTWEMVRELQPDAVVFSDIGPDIRWVGTESGYANDPCWATYTPHGREGRPASVGETMFEEALHGQRDGTNWMPAEVDFSIRPGWFWHESENGKVKTAQQLLDHYFLSVGRGAGMLLNVPPDRRGILHETDVASLKGFGELLDRMYRENHAAGAKAVASNVRGNDPRYKPENVLDDDRYSFWATDDGVTVADLTLELKGAKTFNVVRLRENIALGQRVDDWAVDVWQEGKWVEYAKGSAIGSIRLIRGAPLTATKLRVRITKAAACPCLSDVGIFQEPE